MRKLKLYLDTSIFNFAISDQMPDYRQATLKLFQQIKDQRYEGFISKIVIQEIMKADPKKAEQLMKEVKTLGVESLADNAEIDQLAEQYLKAGLIPEKYANDAMHIAAASYYGLDAIVSWNFEHLVKLKTKRGVLSVNVAEGYHPIEIITPKEVG